MNSTSENSDESNHESEPVLKTAKQARQKRQGKNYLHQLLNKTTKLAKKNVNKTETKTNGVILVF